MAGILKMDLHRLRKSKSTWIILLIFLVLITIALHTVSVEMDMNASGQGASMTIENSYAQHFAVMIEGNLLLLFLVIFLSGFVSAEKNNGYLKNIWGLCSNRFQFFVSKMIITFLYELLLFAGIFIFTLIGTKLWFDGSTCGYNSHFLLFLVTEFLLNFVLSSIILCMEVMIPSTMVSTVAGIAYICAIYSIVYSVINFGVQKLFHVKKFVVQKYLPYGNINTLTESSSTKALERGIVVSVVFFVIVVVTGVVYYRKAELK